ncbi:hypothetical protein BZA77DRAFT_126003 [Pyronema omphalodes]|nr:hypothetical protein BZA77DRAFT_126003 [Pyronema omphalodes]
MPSPIRTDPTRTAAADAAAWEAVRGAGVGLVKWGIVSAIAAVGLNFASPIFRNLTIQFKVYLWMCPSTLGSMMEADWRLRRYEAAIRRELKNEMESHRQKALQDEEEELLRLEARARAAGANS